MRFYTFRQNNSGGSFDKYKYVIVAAHTADEANDKAEEEGPVYFDGCAKGRDCECCGNRWSRVDEYDGAEVPTIYNDVVDMGTLMYDGEEVLLIK